MPSFLSLYWNAHFSYFASEVNIEIKKRGVHRDQDFEHKVCSFDKTIELDTMLLDISNKLCIPKWYYKPSYPLVNGGLRKLNQLSLCAFL